MYEYSRFAGPAHGPGRRPPRRRTLRVGSYIKILYIYDSIIVLYIYTHTCMNTADLLDLRMGLVDALLAAGHCG
jgi:hypothetical protein